MLTDNELILLDAMFDAHVPYHLLEEKAFPLHNNSAYSHGLGSDELRLKLDTLVKTCVLIAKEHYFGNTQSTYYGFSSLGGELWSSERKPIWDRYVEDSQEPTDQEDIWVTRIYSYSEETLIACAKYYTQSHFLGAPVSRLKYHQSNTQRLIYWKGEETVYECQYLAEKKDSHAGVDWIRYQQSRVWWRNIRELQRYFA